MSLQKFLMGDEETRIIKKHENKEHKMTNQPDTAQKLSNLFIRSPARIFRTLNRMDQIRVLWSKRIILSGIVKMRSERFITVQWDNGYCEELPFANRVWQCPIAVTPANARLCIQNSQKRRNDTSSLCEA
jgi:hypothetical protein